MPSSTAVTLFWVAVGVCTIAQLALLHSFFFGRSRPLRDVAPAFRATETVWAVLPALVLATLLVTTWYAMHAPAGAMPMTLESTASTPAAAVAVSPRSVGPAAAAGGSEVGQ